MISQRARYAFKAMVALARAKPGEGLQIRQLCEQEKLPRKFIEQILLKDPEKTFIGPLLRTVDGPIAPLPCLSRTAYKRCDDCRDEAYCELRIAFDKAYSLYLTALEQTTLAEVMGAAGEPARQLLEQ